MEWEDAMVVVGAVLLLIFMWGFIFAMTEVIELDMENELKNKTIELQEDIIIQQREIIDIKNMTIELQNERLTIQEDIIKLKDNKIKDYVINNTKLESELVFRERVSYLECKAGEYN